jgi:hypothetical protein
VEVSPVVLPLGGFAGGGRGTTGRIFGMVLFDIMLTMTDFYMEM